jgi:hypothetical protein
VRPPAALAVTAAWSEEAGAWEIAVPWGRAYLVAEPAREEGPPPRVAAALAGVERLLARAAEGPLALDVVRRGSRWLLLEPGEDAEAFLEWSRADLAATAKAAGLETPPELLAPWLAGVWRDLAAAFARGEAGARGAGHQAVLAGLVARSRAAGGGGQPFASHLAELAPDESRTLAQAFLSPPAAHRALAGTWQGELDNVFYPRDDFRIHLTLDLTQSGTRLDGRATVRIRGAAVDLRVPETAVGGRLLPGLPPRVELAFTAPRPVGRVELTAELGPEGLLGTFRSSLAPKEGGWRAQPDGAGR